MAFIRHHVCISVHAVVPTGRGTLEKLSLPGVLFHHKTPTYNFIHTCMKPWLHYISVEANLSDLKERCDWEGLIKMRRRRFQIMQRRWLGSWVLQKVLRTCSVKYLRNHFAVSFIDACQPVKEGKTWQKDVDGKRMEVTFPATHKTE